MASDVREVDRANSRRSTYRTVMLWSARSIGSVVAGIFVATSALATPHWTLIGWNNLGMHCMDDDYAIFSILPPYNTVNAQLIDNAGRLVLSPAGVTVTYEATADPDGSINTSSIGKSNFWDFSLPLFGVTLPPEMGLAGTMMPGLNNTPLPMAWGATGAPVNSFEALGVPITPIDDQNLPNSYPLFRLVARDATNNVVAQTSVVLPVSSELNCSVCHASGIGQEAAKPFPDWVYDPNPKHDFRLNILKLHDQRNSSNPAYIAALAQFNYRSTGLYDSVILDGKPILCAVCHSSEALGTGGAPNTPSLTASVHSKHAYVIDPTTGGTMDDSNNRSSCYQCHPGSTTRCLRGAMGAAVSTTDGSMLMQCQSCHGSMSLVGSPLRTGWLDEPNCQSCHTGDALSNSGQIRFTTSFDSPGHMRVPTNTRFATNPNTPATGFSLYRFSVGHGGLQCSACHGSTHAEYPSSHRNDNLQSLALQGHVGKLAECTACHVSMPSTVSGGPHGMHPTDQAWVINHHDVIHGNLSQCQVCHAINYSGTVLSRTQGARTLSFKGRPKNFWRGQKITCYDCHDGVDTDSDTRKIAPVVPVDVVLVVSGPSGNISLTASGSVSSFRIVEQPSHGTVALAGNVATYFGQSGFSGSDSFTYAATEATGFVESNLGTVSVTVENTTVTPTPTSTPGSTTPTPSPTASPTATPTSAPIAISGTVSYCSSPALNPVPDVTLTLTGSAFGSTVSGGSGTYQFSSLTVGGTYTVTPAKLAIAPGSAGINTIDAIATQRHFLNLTLLSGCPLTAADVNGDTTINTIDIIAIQRFFLGLSTGTGNVGKYQFNPASRTYPGLVSDQVNQNYDTLVFGDVASSFVFLFGM